MISQNILGPFLRGIFESKFKQHSRGYILHDPKKLQSTSSYLEREIMISNPKTLLLYTKQYIIFLQAHGI